MLSPDARYTLDLINHKTGDRLKIELIDLPIPGARRGRPDRFAGFDLQDVLAEITKVRRHYSWADESD
jgi:hypothetical protein